MSKVNNGYRTIITINGIDYDAGVANSSSGTFVSFARGEEIPRPRAEFYLNEKPHYVDDVEVNRSNGLVTLKIVPK